jgi:hypothetical protein
MLCNTLITFNYGDRGGRDRIVVGFTTTYAISAYHHWCCDRVRISIRARCTTLCDKVCQWLTTGRWFSPRSPVSPTNKTDLHDITEILLKVALNTTKQTSKTFIYLYFIIFLIRLHARDEKWNEFSPKLMEGT